MHTMPTGTFDYQLLEAQAAGLLSDERNFTANAANLAAFLFGELPEVNWAGFYFLEPDGSLVLGPFGGKPACTRLAAGRGVCGAAVAAGRTLIVDDVEAFADHIVCDSASKSEIVVPLRKNGKLIGVLDIDSPVRARFSESDRGPLERIAERFILGTDIP